MASRTLRRRARARAMGGRQTLQSYQQYGFLNDTPRPKKPRPKIK